MKPKKKYYNVYSMIEEVVSVRRKVFLGILLLFSLFFLTGCNPYAGKENFNKIYYDEIKNVKSTLEDNGTFESGKKWDSVRFVMDEMIITINCYHDSSFDTYQDNKSLSDKKVGDITYRFMESQLSGVYTLSEYYFQVEEDTYYISATYVKSDEKDKILKNFLKSIVVEEKKK